MMCRFFLVGLMATLVCDNALGAVGGTVPLRVRESDGSPNVSSVRTINVSNGTLTDNGGGNITISTGGGGGGSGTNYNFSTNGFNVSGTNVFSRAPKPRFEVWDNFDRDVAMGSGLAGLTSSGHQLRPAGDTNAMVISGGKFFIGAATNSAVYLSITNQQDNTPPTYGNFYTRIGGKLEFFNQGGGSGYADVLSILLSDTTLEGGLSGNFLHVVISYQQITIQRNLGSIILQEPWFLDPSKTPGKTYDFDLTIVSNTVVVTCGPWQKIAYASDLSTYSRKPVATWECFGSTTNQIIGRWHSTYAGYSDALALTEDGRNGVLATNGYRRPVLSHLTASRVLMTNPDGTVTNVTSASPTTEFVRPDGTTAAAGSGTPGGNAGAIQFNQSAALDGTNRFIFDRTNHAVSVGTGLRPEAALQISNNSSTAVFVDNSQSGALTRMGIRPHAVGTEQTSVNVPWSLIAQGTSVVHVAHRQITVNGSLTVTNGPQTNTVALYVPRVVITPVELSYVGGTTNVHVDLSTGSEFYLFLTGNAHITFTNILHSMTAAIEMIQDSTGGRLVTYNTNYVKSAAGLYSGPSTNANARDIVTYKSLYGGTNVAIVQTLDIR